MTHPRAPLTFGLGLLAITFAALPGACGGGGTGGSGATGAGGSGASSSSGTTSGGGHGGDSTFVDAGGDANPGQLGCSADLRAVVDANGTVVTTCLPDQGCAAGACIAACAAAEASHSNLGCDFLVPTAPSYPPTLPPCFAAFVANTWPTPVTIGVTRGGMTYDVTKFGRIPQNGMPASAWPPVPATGLPTDQVAVLFLSSDPNSVFLENMSPTTCPVMPAVNGSTVVAGTGQGAAFHITTSAPVSAYDILPYGGANSHFPSAELLFPSNAWGTNYVALATPVGTTANPGPLWGQILASQDGTTIQVLPSVDLPAGGTFPAGPKGLTATYTLDAGDYLQWQLPAGSTDLSGTVVLSDKPVAMFTGNRFYRLQTTEQPGGEATHQQIVPVSSLGNAYVAAPYATRRKDLAPEPIHYRMVGALDGTTLSWDPPVMGGPATLDQGQVADFISDVPFRVSSQDSAHPFSIAQIMSTANVPGGCRPGATAPGYPPQLGDEEFVIMLPPAQFLSRYVFFTDPAYATTNLVLTRVKTATGFDEVTLDCLGTVTGWKPVGTDGKYEVTDVDLVRADVGNGTCTNGRHLAESKSPFGLVVWGLDTYSSYAYPAGGNAAQLTTVTVPPVPK
jgi:hypothetical protein